MHHQDLSLGSEVNLPHLISLNSGKPVFQESLEDPFHLARMPHLDQHIQQIYNIKDETYLVDQSRTWTNTERIFSLSFRC